VRRSQPPSADASKVVQGALISEPGLNPFSLSGLRQTGQDSGGVWSVQATV